MYITLCILKTIIKIKTTIICDECINNQPYFYHTNTVDIAYKFDSYNICRSFMKIQPGWCRALAWGAHGTIYWKKLKVKSALKTVRDQWAAFQHKSPLADQQHPHLPLKAPPPSFTPPFSSRGALWGRKSLPFDLCGACADAARTLKFIMRLKPLFISA